MKALSIRQPWAWLIVEGYKPIENRTWRTGHRGDLQIHAAKVCTPEEYVAAVAFVRRFHPRLAVRIPALDRLELGGVVGIACLTGVVTRDDSPWFTGPVGFVLDRAVPMKFTPMAGMPGIFEVNAAGEPVALPRGRGGTGGEFNF